MCVRIWRGPYVCICRWACVCVCAEEGEAYVCVYVPHMCRCTRFERCTCVSGGMSVEEARVHERGRECESETKILFMYLFYLFILDVAS